MFLDCSGAEGEANGMAFRLTVKRIEPPHDPVDGPGVEPRRSPQPVNRRCRQWNGTHTRRRSADADEIAAALDQAADAAFTDAVVAHGLAFQTGNDGLDREDIPAGR